MPKSITGFVPGTKGKAKVSLHQANDLVQEQLVPINTKRRLLLSACILFKGKNDILPVQCKHVIKSLEELDKDVQCFCELLSETANFPPAYHVLRYRFTSVLYLITEQIDEVSILINNFRDICTTCSLTVRRQRKEIYNSLEELLSNIDDILEKAISLNYEGHRLQKKLLIAQQDDLNDNGSFHDLHDYFTLHVIQ